MMGHFVELPSEGSFVSSLDSIHCTFLFVVIRIFETRKQLYEPSMLVV